MRVTSGRTDPVLSRILVDNSKDTVFWMNEVGGVKMEPAITVAGVKKGNVVVWPRGLVVRAAARGRRPVAHLVCDRRASAASRSATAAPRRN